MPRPSFAWIPFVATLVALPCLAQDAPVKPAAAETFVVEGRVVDMRGEGIPAAAIHASTWTDPTALARTVADGDGYFRLARVPMHQSVLVKAAQDGYCVGVAHAAPRTRTVQIPMQHATTVKGVLRNRAGRPVADTLVAAEPIGRSLTYVQCETRTNASGEFTLTAVPLAPIHVCAWVDGEGLATTRRHVAGPCEVELVPNEPKVTTLQVTIEGLPESSTGVDLRLLPYREGGMQELPPPLGRPRIGRDGRWTLPFAPDVEYLVMPSSPDLAFAPREVRVEAGKGPHDLRFTAKAIGSAALQLRAEVRGPDDKPIGGLPFALRAPNGGATATATSAADGTMAFASPLAAGTRIVVYTTDPAWVVDPAKGDDPLPDRRSLTQHETTVDPTTTLALRVVPACSVRGRVLQADGRPLPFARVELQESMANRMPHWMTMSWATADRDGSFRFEGRHHLDDKVRLFVQGNAGTYEGEPFAMAAAGTKVDVADVKLAPPSAIDGVLRDDQQRPVPGVRVWLREWDMTTSRQRSGSVTETLTDRDGRYRFLGVPPGGAYLQVLGATDERSGLGRKAVEPFEVEPGKTYTHDLAMPEGTKK